MAKGQMTYIYENFMKTGVQASHSVKSGGTDRSGALL
jgi:hypothetical protein